MVTLSRITTKIGDGGQTALGDGTMVPKNNLRVTAYGEVDELNATLGVAILNVGDSFKIVLQTIQNDLFDVGADLCVPQTDATETGLRITPAYVQRLETALDTYLAPLTPLTSFILPGGTPASAWLHLARTVCRRAERVVVSLSQAETINPQVVIYLNRLSDLLFVLARSANQQGKDDVLWKPGGQLH